MKIAVLGTGMVGTTIANKLLELEHEVTLASRTADNPKARAWLDQADHRRAHMAVFADAAANASGMPC